MKKRIFIIDDDQSMCEMLADDLTRRGFEPSWFLNAPEALSALQKSDIDLIVTDLHLPGYDGIKLCEQVTLNRPDIPVIVLTAFGSLETAVAAIRAGAYDFVTKPVDLDLLLIALTRAIKHRQLQTQVKTLQDVIERSQKFEELIGESQVMQDLFQLLNRIADTDTSILITGESGTGKELVARALHHRSQRRVNPFIAINCSALPEHLLESELFGHKRGAFTDAQTDRKGLFLQAHGGTLFLDEVGDIPLLLQPKLLRALEERCVRPIGSNREISFDVRIIAATNRKLETAVAEGQFREDLYYRLNVIQINVPSLQTRGSDILLLATFFIEKFRDRFHKNIAGLSQKAAQKLLEYPWPGNVRELRNAIERAVAVTRFDKIIVDDLPETIRSFQSYHIPLGVNSSEALLTLSEVERRYILHVLNTVADNKTSAARILGIDRKTLYRKLKEFEETES